jgi:hypothetical protein
VGRRWRRRSWNGESTYSRSEDRRGWQFYGRRAEGQRSLSAGQHERGPRSVERANCAYLLLDHARGCYALLCRCRSQRSPRRLSNPKHLECQLVASGKAEDMPRGRRPKDKRQSHARCDSLPQSLCGTSQSPRRRVQAQRPRRHAQ